MPRCTKRCRACTTWTRETHSESAEHRDRRRPSGPIDVLIGQSASDAKRHRTRVAAVVYHGDLVRMGKLTEAGTTCTSCMQRLRTVAPSPITRRAVERALQASTKSRLEALANANEAQTKP